MCNGKRYLFFWASVISQINCFVLNASLKMSNVILGIASLSPVLLVLCYICNKCLLVGERRMEFISLENVWCHRDWKSWKGNWHRKLCKHWLGRGGKMSFSHVISVAVQNEGSSVMMAVCCSPGCCARRCLGPGRAEPRRAAAPAGAGSAPSERRCGLAVPQSTNAVLLQLPGGVKCCSGPVWTVPASLGCPQLLLCSVRRVWMREQGFTDR